MKKFSKLLCALLVVAVLCSCLIFTVSAEGGDTVVRTDDSAALTSAVVVNGEDNTLKKGTGSWYMYQQKSDSSKNQVDSYVVTPEGSDDSYVVFNAGQYQDGVTSQNLQFAIVIGSKDNMIPLTNESFYVVDIEIATPSSLITSVSLSLNNRDANGANFPFGQVNKYGPYFGNYISNLGADWTHFTVVGDIENNILHFFVNGAYVKSEGVAYDNVAEGTTPEEYGLRAQGIKVEVGYNASKPFYIYQNESIAFDNITRRDIVDEEGIAEMRAIIDAETKDITSWSGYPTETRVGTSLPNYVEIDGVQYNNMTKANEALAASATKVVNVLNNCPSALVVEDDCTVITNGKSINIWGPEGTVLTETDGVVTVKTPYKQNAAIVGTAEASAVKGETRLDRADNRLSWYNIIGTKADTTAGYANGAIVTNNVTGQKYYRWLNNGITDSSNSYIDIKTNDTGNSTYQGTIITYEEGASQYMVYDFDLSYLSGSSFRFNVASICREVNSNTAFWASNPNLAPVTAGWEPGVFHHVTVILDYNTNKSLVFVDNVLELTQANGVMSASGFTTWTTAEGNQVRQEALRLGQNQSQSTAFDNMCVRYIKNDDSLDAAVAANDLSGWSDTIYTGDYVLPVTPALASVDGENVYSVEQLEEKLALRGNKNVELFHGDFYDVTVNGGAVIETHGIANINLVAAEGITSTQDGTVITFVAPFSPSEIVEIFAADGNLATPAAIMNAISNGALRNVNVNRYGTYINACVITDNSTGDKYFDIRSIASANANSLHQYVDLNVTDAPAYVEDTFNIFEFDAYVENEAIYDMYIQASSRTGGGTSMGTNKTYLSELNLPVGEWVHLTIVYDITNNTGYIYVNNELRVKLSQALWQTKDYEDFDAASAAGLKFDAFRINLNTMPRLNEDQNFAIDNVKCVCGSTDPWIVANIGAQSLEAWENNNFKEGYKFTSIPVMATIDGVAYSSIKEAEAVLADGGEHTISIERDFPGAITVDSSAAIVTHNFAGKVAPAAPKVVTLSDGSLLLQATIVTDNGDGTLAYLQTNESNYTDYTAGIMWIDEEGVKYEQIYYTFGTTVEYVGTMFDVYTAYIQNGQLIVPDWTWYNYADEEQESLIGKVVVDKSYDNAFYAMPSTRDAGAANIKYNLSLYSNFVINLYVPAATCAKPTEIMTVIDGTEYYVYQQALNATEAAEVAGFGIVLTVDGSEYYVKVPVSILTYAKTIFANENYSEQLKQVIYAALEYANEASKALVTGGTDVEAIADILNANSAYATADAVVGDSADYSSLVGIVSAARLRLDAQPDFVIEMNPEYVGEITVTYKNFAGEEVTETFTSNGEGEEFIITGMKVYEFANTLTIKAGEAVGQYSLETYINGLTEAGTDSAFATALLNYAKLALAYKELIK